MTTDTETPAFSLTRSARDDRQRETLREHAPLLAGCGPEMLPGGTSSRVPGAA